MRRHHQQLDCEVFARCIFSLKIFIYFSEAQSHITRRNMSFPHPFPETENATVQLFLSEHLRRLFISWSGAFNQNPFSVLHFSQAVYVTIPSLIIGKPKASYTQNTKDKDNVRVKGFLEWGLLMGCLSLFTIKICYSRDAFGMLSETFCHDLRSYTLLKGLGVVLWKVSSLKSKNDC